MSGGRDNDKPSLSDFAEAAWGKPLRSYQRDLLDELESARADKLPLGRVTGFEESSGPGESAWVKADRFERASRVEWRVDDIKRASRARFDSASDRFERDIAARMRAATEEALKRGVFTPDPPWHPHCRSQARPQHADGSTWSPPAQEVITDPRDRRGLDARRARVPS